MSHYLTFIVRLRIDEPAAGLPPEQVVRGSLQQVGAERVQHFASVGQAAALLRAAAEGKWPVQGKSEALEGE